MKEQSSNTTIKLQMKERVTNITWQINERM